MPLPTPKPATASAHLGRFSGPAPILFWWLGEGSGSTVSDPINGDTGTLAAGTTWTTGYNGTPGLLFDGISGAVRNSRVVNTGVVTIALRLKLLTAGANLMFAGWQNGPGGGTFDKDLGTHYSGEASFYGNDGGQHWASDSSGALPANTWTTLVGVADGTNLVLYRDKVSVGSIACGPTNTSYTVADIFLGGNAGFSYANFVADYLAVWNQVLSAAQVAEFSADPFAMLAMARVAAFNGAPFGGAVFNGPGILPKAASTAFNGGPFGRAIFNGPGIMVPPAASYITLEQAIIPRLMTPPAGGGGGSGGAIKMSYFGRRRRAG